MVFNRIFKSDFLKNISILLSGTVIAQIITFSLSPLLTRLYTPEDFGILALFMSISAIFGVIATGRFELAIVLPKEDKDANNILVLSVILTTFTALFSLILLSIFNAPITDFSNNPAISKWLYFVFFSVLFTGLYQAFNNFSIRNKTFKTNAFGRIFQAFSMTGIQLILGFISFGSAGLIIGTIVGQLFAALILSWKWIANYSSIKPYISKSLIKYNFKRYNNFLKINTPHALIDTIQDSGIIFVITIFFSQVVLGSYAFAFRILKVPVSMLGSAMYQVFYQKASEAYNNGQDIRPLLLKIYRNLFIIGFPVFLILTFTTPTLFKFIFGEKWILSGEIAQILCPWLFFNFLASPVSCITLVLNKQKEAMYITLVDIFLRTISLIIGGIYDDYKLSFILMSTSCSILLIFALIWFYRIAKNKIPKLS